MTTTILTDIEGTTSSISFVKDVLCPDARRELPRFVREHSQEPEVRRWLDAGCARHVVCTVKFQGATDHDAAAAFAAIPGGTLFHGAHNRHELTFCRLSPEGGRG